MDVAMQRSSVIINFKKPNKFLRLFTAYAENNAFLIECIQQAYIFGVSFAKSPVFIPETVEMSRQVLILPTSRLRDLFYKIYLLNFLINNSQN
jgi:hypothetical protein